MWFYIACFVLISFGCVVTMLENAPLGYEDENGFHYGIDK